MSLRTRFLAGALAVAALCVPALAAPLQAEKSDARERTEPWPSRVIELAENLPIQDGGRIKPLSTFASFSLLRLNGRRSVKTAQDERLTATEWLLDALFFPEAAARYPVFLVQRAEVVEALGISIQGKRQRDRYSLVELQPALNRLVTLAHEYSAIEPKNRTSVQAQLVHLAENVLFFLDLTERQTVPFVAPIGPADTSESAGDHWMTISELRAQRANGLSEAHSGVLRNFEALQHAAGSPADFESSFQALQEQAVALAQARGEYGKIGLEVAYYKARPLLWSQISFTLAFLAAACMWLRPRGRLLYGAASGAVALAALLLAAAIVVRCMIRGRPPVSTLYETVLFVTAVGTLVAMTLEALNRQRIAVSAAAFLGMVGLAIANGYETLDKQDTMPSLVAVLDTNFWLSIHVTAITIGYSSGMLAALLASIYLLSKTFRWKLSDLAYYRGLARMVYGVLCFGLLFSLVGTILGGIWANESWGRFWGWDPKENGALLIVITHIAILHARMGGLLREHGLCMAAAFGGTVVAFSWWGVNLLGVGLHSYGFTSGIHSALWTYYAIQWGIVALGGAVWLLERSVAKLASHGGDVGVDPGSTAAADAR